VTWDDDRDTDYAEAGFGGHLAPGSRPALVIVDPARAYVDPDCGLYAGEGAVAAAEAMRSLLASARAAGIPVVITEVVVRADRLDAGIFGRKVAALDAFCEGSPFGQFIDGLAPMGAELRLTKKYPSAYFGTELSSYLTAQRVDTVLIAGFSTSGCVRATTLDTMQYGFIPIVVSDATGDRVAGIHESNLFDMQAKMGEVWSLQSAQEYLKECAAEGV
jgi:maleamate amidohydrolase